MGDERVGDVTHAEQLELDALRRRAYGPDADISGDAAALERLLALEDRLRIDQLRRAGGRLPGELDAAQPRAPAPDSETPLGAMASPSPPPRPRARRLRLTLIAGTMGAATLLGIFAWNATRPDPSADVTAQVATTPAVTDDQRAAEYERYLDGLRDEVLSLPGSERVAPRMRHDDLRPYGILYGRTVGVGPTVDDEFCMIIADLPASSISCIPLDDARAVPVSVTLPAWYADSDSDVFTGLGRLVSYTLMPGGGVVAVPAE